MTLFSLAESLWGRRVSVGGGNVLVDLGSNTARDRLDSFGSSGTLLLVDVNVERNKQDEVRGQDGTAAVGSAHGAGTVRASEQKALQLRKVGENNLLEGGEVNKAQVQDELDDLETGDPLLPPDTNASGGQEVVPVHHHVDAQVQGDRHPGNRGLADQLGVAQQGGSTMVVGVQECQSLLLDHQEHSVDELGELGQVVQVVQKNELLGPCVRAADGVEQAVVVDDGDELLSHQHQQGQGQEREEQVVDLEQAIQDKRLDAELLEDEVSAEDNSVVRGDGSSHWREGAQRCLTNDKGEFRRNKAATQGSSHGFIEERPQGHEKRRFGRQHGKNGCCWWSKKVKVKSAMCGGCRQRRQKRKATTRNAGGELGKNKKERGNAKMERRGKKCK